MRLIFVYNIDSNFSALIAGTVHKLASPKSYPCNLCKLTYPTVLMSKRWKTFVASLPYVTAFLHRDEFIKQYPNQTKTELPAAFVEDDSGLYLLLSREEINKAQNIAELIQITKNSLAPRAESEISYRCHECGLYYRDKEIAQSCENWCKEHKSCNLEIIKHTIK